MGRQSGLLAACTVILGCLGQHAQATTDASALGAYIGCFDLQKLARTDPNIATQAVKQYNAGRRLHWDRLAPCTAHCKSLNYTMSVITPDMKCRCAIAVPDATVQLPDTACGHTGQGAAVFYHHDLAASQACRLAPLPLSASSVDIHYNPDHVMFYKDENFSQENLMRLTMNGTDGIRLAPKDSWQTYGSVEVTAMVDGTSGAVSAFYLRSSDVYTLDNKGDFDEIDFEFVNGKPAVKNSIWLNSYKGGVEYGEHMLQPRNYQPKLLLSAAQTNANTFIKYTIHWQPSRVTWAMNGVPMYTRKTGQNVPYEPYMTKLYTHTYAPPAVKSHLSFSMWSDSRRSHFGGLLDLTENPYHSYFHSLKRIVCDTPVKPLPSALNWLAKAGTTSAGTPVAKPPVLKAPATKPPAAKPPAVKPVVTKPPAIKPPVVKTPVTKPPAIKPPIVKLPVVKAPVSKPPAIKPPVVKLPNTKHPINKMPPAIKSPVTKLPTTTLPAKKLPTVKPTAVKPTGH